jgi:hypothetical protein
MKFKTLVEHLKNHNNEAQLSFKKCHFYHLKYCPNVNTTKRTYIHQQQLHHIKKNKVLNFLIGGTPKK